MKITNGQFLDLTTMLAAEWFDQCPELTCHPRGGGALPALPTVYLLVRSDDTIVYVGHTSDLLRRSRRHECDPHIAALGHDRYYYFEPGIKTKTGRLSLETTLIALCRPIGNRAIMLRLGKQQQLSEIRFKTRRYRRS